MKNKYLSYAVDFVSFMLNEVDIEDIRNIILFGSVSRNEATKESDIDLFVDVTHQEERYQQKIRKVLDTFYASKFFNNYWKLRGIENNFNIVVGKLDEWKDLKESIISTGISLYSKFKILPEKYQYGVLIYFENIKPESKRVLVSKKMYGYKHQGKQYPGLLEKYGGTKLNKGTIMVSLEHKNIFLSLLRTFKIQVKFRNIVEY